MTAAPALAPAGTRWRLGEHFMLRVGGLPYATVEPLRCPDAAARAAELLDLHDALARDGEALSETLHGLIGGTEDTTIRRTLLALRRQVFADRMPADPVAALAAVAALDAGAVAPVRDWLDRRRRATALQGELAGVLDREIAASRDELWRLSAVARLRAGVQVASPALDEQLVALAGRTGAPPAAKKLRRVERSILSYLYRTACKTSPFSTFTGIAFGHFDDSGVDASVLAQVLHFAPRGGRNATVRLNVVVLARIADAILADPVRRGDLPVVLSPGLRRDADRVRYVRQWITQGDDSAAVSLDSVQDALFYLRRSGTLDRLIEVLGSGVAWRYADLAGWLRAETDAADGMSEEYLSVLLRLDIVQIDGFAVEVHTRDPLRAFQEFLAGLDRAWATRVAIRLEEVIAHVDAFGDGDLGARRAAARGLRHTLAGIQADLGASGGSLPQTLLYEDCRTGGELAMPAGPWQRAVAGDLAAVQEILPAFDMTLPQRILFRGFFLARYGRGGRCDDLLRLVEDFHEDIYDQYVSVTGQTRPPAEDGLPAAEENWLNQPELPRLDRIRRAVAGYIRSAVAADPGTTELFLDATVLRELGDGMGDVLGEFRPVAHFAQLAGRADGPLLVLNQSMGGLSFPFSRFTHAFDDPATRMPGRLRAQAAAVVPPGAVFAEVTGGQATTNLNLHAQLTDYVIVCPGESTRVPAECRLDLDDLFVVHEVATDRVVLRSKRLDREVIPVYLGYLMPMALPRLHRTLLLLMSPASMAALDLWRGVPAQPDAHGITARPRVRVGDVVIARRSWTLEASRLPRRTDGGTDADWFLGWHRWRRATGVPARFFATVNAPGAGRAQRPKPQYVDCDSYLSLVALDALLTDESAQVTIREMLPAADELTVASPAGRHVAEFAFETFPTIGDPDAR